MVKWHLPCKQQQCAVENFVTSIYQNSVAPSNLIYRSVLEIDSGGGDDVTQVVVQHVDPIDSFKDDVTYILTT